MHSTNEVVAYTLGLLVEIDAFGRVTYETVKRDAALTIKAIAEHVDKDYEYVANECPEWVYNILTGMHKQGLIDLEPYNKEADIPKIYSITITRSGIELYKMLQVT